MRLGRDGLTGLIGLLVSLVLLWASFGLPKLPLVPIGPGFYPRIVLVVMALVSVALLVQDVRRTARTGTSDLSFALHPLVALGFAVIGLYIALLPALGFRLATMLFVAAFQTVIERPRTPAGWLVLASTAVATALTCHLVFERYLLVLLPRGTWTGW